MENLNKNWLVILLVAVVFGTLGFLVGRTTGHDRIHRTMRLHGPDLDGDELNINVEVEEDSNAIVKMDTILKDGKQIIIKEVRKIKKR